MMKGKAFLEPKSLKRSCTWAAI